MSLGANTTTVLQIALANPQAANDIVTNINTPSPGATNVTSTSATALTVAAAGVNYGLQVDESTASAVTGLKIKPAAAGAGLAVSVINGNSAENLTLDAKGAGQVIIGATSTGLVSIGRGSVSTPIESGAKAAISGATPQTATAAQLLGGYIVSSGNSSAVSFTTDTGANLDTAVPGAVVGDCFYTVIYNANTSTGAITFHGGSNVTLQGGATTLAISKVAILFFSKTGTGTWDCNAVISA